MLYLTYVYFSILAIVSTFYKKKLNIFVYIGIIGNILIEGLRWNTGVDWNSYLYYYQNIDNISESFSYFEYGYYALNMVFNYMNLPYNLMLLLISVFVGYAIHYRMYVFCGFNPLSVCITLSILHLFLGSNRQIIAISLSTLALLNYSGGNKKSSIFLLFSAFYSILTLHILQPIPNLF
jgi:hypothetical protein